MKDNNNISQEFLESVERYYNNTMPTDERIAFEEKLQNDTEFKTQVEDLQMIFLGIASQSFKEQLDLFHEDIPQVKKQSKVRYLQFIKMGIAAAIIIGIGLFWMNGNSSNERLYAKYFTPDPGLPTTMSTTTTTVTTATSKLNIAFPTKLSQNRTKRKYYWKEAYAVFSDSLVLKHTFHRYSS